MSHITTAFLSLLLLVGITPFFSLVGAGMPSGDGVADATNPVINTSPAVTSGTEQADVQIFPGGMEMIHNSSFPDNSYVLVTAWGESGSGTGEFIYPGGIAVDSSDHIYIADYGNHRIQKFGSDGSYLSMWGVNGTENG